MAFVATATIGSAVLGAGASIYGAKQQAHAAENAADLQMQQFNQNQTNLEPYRALGQSAVNPLLQAMGYTKGDNGEWQRDQSSPLQKQFSFTPTNLENYPGYKFALEQGLLGVNASAAAKGLGVSGADIKGAAQFAQGLASQTYEQAYDQALSSFNTNYNAAASNANRLYQLVSTGQNAAAQTGSLGSAAAGNAGNLTTSGAAAGAAGLMGAANAISSGAGNYLNYTSNNNLVNAINNATGGGGSFKMPTLPTYDTSAPTVNMWGQ